MLVSLWLISALAQRIIPAQTAYVDTRYIQALALSTAYQGGIVAWVAFWALYGHGFSVENLSAVGSFGLAYMSVILVEPLIDLECLPRPRPLPATAAGHCSTSACISRPDANARSGSASVRCRIPVDLEPSSSQSFPSRSATDPTFQTHLVEVTDQDVNDEWTVQRARYRTLETISLMS
ncbi:hypothetical protein GGE07_005391 [Sinorhizobium terangae]|nr:hypothetical protein [Sinorhizobium terangae]